MELPEGFRTVLVGRLHRSFDAHLDGKRLHHAARHRRRDPDGPAKGMVLDEDLTGR
jgi:hypothetical protein